MLDCFLSRLLDMDQNDTDIVTMIIVKRQSPREQITSMPNPAFSTGTLEVQNMTEQLQPATG